MKPMGLFAVGIALMPVAACNQTARTDVLRSNETTVSNTVTSVDRVDANANVTAAAPAAKPQSAPAVTPGFDWAYRVNEGRVSDAVLAYEKADTDMQPLNFSCEDGGNSIFAGTSGGPRDQREITLTSGDQTLRLTGKTDPNDEEGTPTFVSQEIAGDSPFIHAFLANGWLRMTTNGGTTDMAATAAGKKAILQFVAFCTRDYQTP